VLSLFFIFFPNIFNSSTETIVLQEISFPSQVYKGENLIITTKVKNTGIFTKDALVQVRSASETKSESIGMMEPNMVSSVTVAFQIYEIGQQSFEVKVYWAGLASINRVQVGVRSIPSILVMGPKLEITPSYEVFSQMETKEWILSITNKGNAPAKIVKVRITNYDPLLLASSDTVTLGDLAPTEKQNVKFIFTVPKDAALGENTVTLNTMSTFGNDMTETAPIKFPITVQKNPTIAQVESATASIYAIGGLLAAIAIIAGYLSSKKRR